ncbi:MAG: hypothetical protein ACMXX7_01350 [Candidatus Woesearchaeota archaeon]
MFKRGQAAVEFLTTYGWAFFVILAMLGSLSYFGVLDPSSFVSPSCNVGSPFYCDRFVVGEDGFLLGLRNVLNENLVVTDILVDSLEGEVSCFGFSQTLIVSGGGDVVTCFLSDFDLDSVDFRVVYRSQSDVSGTFSRRVPGRIRGGSSAGLPGGSVISFSSLLSLDYVSGGVDHTLSGIGWSVDWHPSGDFLAVGHDSLSLFGFSGSLLSYVSDGVSQSLDPDVRSVAWHPSGDFLVAAHGNSVLSLFEFTGSELVYVPGGVDTALVGGGLSLSWHNDFLVVGHSGLNHVHLFELVGGQLNLVSSTSDIPDNAWDVSWHHSGDYVVVGHSGGDHLSIFEFDGSDLIYLPNNIDHTLSAPGGGLNWFGNLLAVSYDTDDRLAFFDFDSGFLSLSSVSVDVPIGSAARGSSWSNDGSFIAIVRLGANHPVYIYEFDGSSATLFAGSNSHSLPGTGRGLSWHPSGDFLVVPHNGGQRLSLFEVVFE